MSTHPWYRERWPWLLMAGPAIVVVAGVATAVLAVTSFDGLVAEDYYKQGLGINRDLAREANARTFGVAAMVQFSEDRTRVRVMLDPGAAPERLTLSLVHPTLAARDQSIPLARKADGWYEAAMRPPGEGAMRVKLEDGDGVWRISGDWRAREATLRLAARKR
jgi:uncharacterized protein